MKRILHAAIAVFIAHLFWWSAIAMFLYVILIL
jgi:hypothetical protein